MFGYSIRATALACAALVGSSLAAAPGNIGACYSPFHSQAYPLHGERLTSTDGVKAAIENDFKQLAGHFTHIRTYYSQYLDIDIAPIAAANGIKLYMGVYLTNEAWGKNEVEAAVRAVKEHPDTIEAIMVGSENLVDHRENADTILNKVNEIKGLLGADLAAKVKFGTAQRVNEYLDESFSTDMAKLSAGLEILGVNIYPFFTNSYDPANPETLLDQMWKNVAAKFPTSKLRVTETGYPTDGSNPSMAPNVKPSLENSVGYYEGLLNWAPPGAEGSTKFWFQAFDLRGDDKSMGVDYETHFGFFTADGQSKKANFPYPVDSNNFQPKPVTTPAAPTAAPGPTSAAPSAPGAPGAPATPGTPGAPATPGAPGAPATPGAPGAPAVPGAPVTPGTPSVPGVPSSAPVPAPTTATPIVTPSPTPKNGLSFGDIGNEGDAPGKIGGKTNAPAANDPKQKTAKKKDCHV